MPGPGHRRRVRPGRRPGRARSPRAATRCSRPTSTEVDARRRRRRRPDRRLDVTLRRRLGGGARAGSSEHWGGLDVLVNNAGVAGGGRIDVAAIDEWQWITEINLFGVVRGTPHVRADVQGAALRPRSSTSPRSPAWCTRPGWLLQRGEGRRWWRSPRPLGHELAPYGVRAHVVCPSYFRTNLMDSMRGGDDRRSAEVVGAAGRAARRSPPTTSRPRCSTGIDARRRGDRPRPAPRRQAYALKRHDRPAYDAVMRAQAAKLDAASSRARERRVDGRRRRSATRTPSTSRRSRPGCASTPTASARPRRHARGAAVPGRRVQPDLPAALPRPRPDPAPAAERARRPRAPTTWAASTASSRRSRRSSRYVADDGRRSATTRR